MFVWQINWIGGERGKGRWRRQMNGMRMTRGKTWVFLNGVFNRKRVKTTGSSSQASIPSHHQQSGPYKKKTGKLSEIRTLSPTHFVWKLNRGKWQRKKKHFLLMVLTRECFSVSAALVVIVLITFLLLEG